MNDTIKVRPRLVLVRFYMDFVIRHVTVILLQIKADAQNNTVTFITINSAMGVGNIKQRNIVISNIVKFDIVELDSDGISADIMSKIFTNGYHEYSEFISQRIEDKGEVVVVTNSPARAIVPNIPKKQNITRNESSKLHFAAIAPIARVVPSAKDSGETLADVTKRVAAVMQKARNPMLHIEEAIVADEGFDPDAQQAEVDEDDNA